MTKLCYSFLPRSFSLAPDSPQRSCPTFFSPIREVARKLELPDKYFEQIGSESGKVRLELLSDPAFMRHGKLIIVTATTPTAAGEGKTVTSLGLTQGLAHIGKKVVITSREPSLGLVFGMKGGAAGGGLSQIEPSSKINLHFNGDFHAIASAHNRHERSRIALHPPLAR